MENETCCPVFDPVPWNGVTHEWDKKQFIKAKVFTLFFIPVNFARVMKRLDVQIQRAGAAIPDQLCLSDHASKWNMDVYCAVDREVPGAEQVTMSGTYYSKVYEGPFQDTKKWCLDLEKHVADSSLDIEKWYMWYTTCPKCAKKYGKNYVVIFGQVR